MAKELKRNVFVDGKWYGPTYPDNGNPPSDVENPAAYEDDVDNIERSDPRETADDGGDSKRSSGSGSGSAQGARKG